MQLFYGKPHASASDGVIYIPGATIATHIRLSRLPLLENEAASKSYVDSAVQNLNVSRLSGQALAVSNLPAIGGHFYNVSGTNVTMYQPTGVTPGWKSSITVNSRGQVTGGGELSVEDFPNLDYSLVNSGQPTDLAGLGITDVISDAGGALADNVTLVGDPTQNAHAASKSYTQAVAATGGSNGLSVGDIVAIYSPQASDEEGLLRANGGQVNIADYPELYAKVGAQALNTSVAGYGRPWVLQNNGINPNQSTSIMGWAETNTAPVGLINPICFFTKNRVYMTAGLNGTQRNTNIYTATVNTAGEIGVWNSTGNAYISGEGFHDNSTSVFLANDKVFLFGYKSTGVAQSGYVVAPINQDGSIGTFADLVPLPFSLENTGPNVLFKLGNKVYCPVGRQIYMSEFNKNGELGSWQIYDQMPDDYSRSGMFVVTTRYVYVINHITPGGAPSTNMLRAGHDQNGTLTNWTTVPGLLPYLYNANQFLLTDKALYILGGGAGATTNYRLPVYDDGSLGSVYTDSNLSSPKTYGGVIATSSYLYIIGGTSGSGGETRVIRAPIIGSVTDMSPYYSSPAVAPELQVLGTTPGSGQPWREQYEINEEQFAVIDSWVTNSAGLPRPISRGAAFVHKNRIYLMGGYYGTQDTPMVYSAGVGENGALSGWSPIGSLPMIVSDSQVITTSNRVYLIGGYGDNAAVLATVYTTTIDAVGNFTGWSNLVPSLPEGRFAARAVVVRNRVYLIGGRGSSGGTSNTIYTATLGSDGTMGTWSSYNPFPISIENHGTAVVKNKLYVLGGLSQSGIIGSIYCATINYDGTLSNWTVTGSLPQALRNHEVYVTKNRIYVLGGYGSSGAVSTVYSAGVSSDGSLGLWSTHTLPVSLSDSHVVAVKNHLLLLGGVIGSSGLTSDIYSAPISGGLNDYSSYNHKGSQSVSYIYDNGRLSGRMPGAGRPWEQQYHFNTTQSAAFGSTIQYQTAPIDISDTQVVVTKDKAFFIGGTQSGNVANTVKKVDLLPDGTLDFTWTNWNNLPKQLERHQVVTVGNKVYVMGGVDEQGTYSSSVYKSVIDQNGELGEWVAAPSLPIQLAEFASAVVGDCIYTYGGLTVGGTRTANCYRAVLDASGEITTWETNETLPQPVSHASIAVTANYVYLIGGHNTTGYINNVYRAIIDSAGRLQSMMAVGSGPVTARFEHCLVTRSHVYLMQAYDGTNSYLGRVYAAPITSQGTIGAWSSPFTRAQVTKIGCVNFVVGGKMYMVGGSDPTLATPSKRMYVTAFAGGSNDYSLYYGKGVVKYSEPTKFYLPYVNKPELSGVTYYVKY